MFEETGILAVLIFSTTFVGLFVELEEKNNDCVVGVAIGVAVGVDICVV
jgi:hypothetical protein